MKYLVNGTLSPEKSREALLAEMAGRTLSDEAWELVRTGVISERGYKIGAREDSQHEHPPAAVAPRRVPVPAT